MLPRSWSFSMLVSLVCLWCVVLVSPTAACGPPTPAPPATPPMLPNLLVQAAGRVEVWRQGSTRFVPVGFGAELQPGDTLRPLGGDAAVFCGDETLWDGSPLLLPTGDEYGVPCLEGRPPRPAPDISPLRGEATVDTGAIPYVLSPRSGWVWDGRPRLRWHALSGVQVYSVTLVSDDGQGRPTLAIEAPPPSPQENGDSVECAYPGAWPALRADASYRLIVEGDGQRSDAAGALGQGFSRLDAEQAAQLDRQEAHLRQRPITGPAVTLLLTELYLGHGLRSEAVDLLLAAPDGEQVAAIQSELGETYLAMGLFAEAQAALEQALVLAQEDGLPEAEAAAHYGLGLAACGQWDAAAAREQWQKAETQYQALEMPAQAAQAAGWLADAGQACSPTPGGSGGSPE
jgi:hypothetical protein